MATRKRTAADTVDGMKVYLEEEEEPTVTMTRSELRELIAQEVRAQTAAGQQPRKPVKMKPAKEHAKVKIKLFKDNGRYSKPVFVAVNGHKFMVPRGVEVEVPDYIAQVLEESFRRDQQTADQLMQLERKFREESRKLN